MKKTFFMLGCLLVLGSTPVLAQGKPEVVTVRIEEQGFYLYIYTARSGSERVETQELETAKKERPGSLIVRAYQQVMSTYLDQGYTLQSQFTNRFGAENSINTFIFVKPSKS
jgi:hypothetical protein